MTAAPVDRGVDRRAFLARTAALAAASAVGGAVGLPAVASAAGPARTPLLTAAKWNPALDVPNAYVKPRPEAVADPTELTVAEAAWLIRAGTLTPAKL
ncbi:amidase, partial [Micromonospora sp. DH15]|nr:amidase [Micromonospora sp. DH15]